MTSEGNIVERTKSFGMRRRNVAAYLIASAHRIWEPISAVGAVVGLSIHLVVSLRRAMNLDVCGRERDSSHNARSGKTEFLKNSRTALGSFTLVAPVCV